MGANPIRPIGRSAESNQSEEGGNKFVKVLCVMATFAVDADRVAEVDTFVSEYQAVEKACFEADVLKELTAAEKIRRYGDRGWASQT